MNREIVLGILVLGLATACGKDDPQDEAVPVQGAPSTTDSLATNDTAAKVADPVASSEAPAQPAPSRPAATIAANAAATELANARVIRTVQVGAFPASETAEWWVNELRRKGIPAYSVHTMVNGAEVTRLRIGAATSAADARAIADKIHARYEWPVWITTVEDRSMITGEMLVASREYAGR